VSTVNSGVDESWGPSSTDPDISFGVCGDHGV